MKRQQAGFTLVEIAIVLVIIGLLLGGILKGQELVQNARVRNLADQQNSVAAAYFAFQDRYRALPGDYAAASTNIPNVAAPACPTGTANCTAGDSQITGPEIVHAWHHLTNAGFISCPTCAAPPGAGAVPGVGNSLLNAYNGFMELSYDNKYAGASPVDVNNLKSGAQIPSNILAEVDRKLDDGSPVTGKFRNWTASPAACAPVPGGGVANWESVNPQASCQAVNLF